MGGVYLHFDQGIDYLEPSLWVSVSEFFPTQLDANLKCQFATSFPFWIGGGWNSFNAWRGEVGWISRNIGNLETQVLGN